MNKKCVGCGASLQSDKPEIAGYIESGTYEKATLCRRCFRLKCYGDYVHIKKDNDEYLKMLKDINETKDLVLYLVDLFNINDSIKVIDKHLDNPIILVLTKREIIPKSINTSKITKWIERYHLNIIDIIDISSEKNYHLDQLYSSINKHKKTKNVYVVGNTNAGKSTLINKLMKNYAHKEGGITISPLPLTTMETMNIDLSENLTLIDTPGLIDDGNIINVIDFNRLKQIIPKKEIKPCTYQLKAEQSLAIDDIARIDYVDGEPNSFTFYISNELNIEHVNYIRNDRVHRLKKTSIEINGHEDIVINGLCWIKIVKPAIVDVYTLDNVLVYKRDSII